MRIIRRKGKRNSKGSDSGTHSAIYTKDNFANTVIQFWISRPNSQVRRIKGSPKGRIKVFSRSSMRYYLKQPIFLTTGIVRIFHEPAPNLLLMHFKRHALRGNFLSNARTPFKNTYRRHKRFTLHRTNALSILLPPANRAIFQWIYKHC